jgi:hypothetical protein
MMSEEPKTSSELDLLLQEAKELRQKVIKHLVSNIDKFVFCTVDTRYVIFRFDDWTVKIWTANGEESASFYEEFAGLKLQDGEYTEEEQKRLWDFAQSFIKQEGEHRKIEQTQLSNDLFFRFKGVYGEVKFTGYNDHDWWSKYKPKSVKENDDITWKIDWDTMQAVYKPKSPPPPTNLE